MATGHDTEGQSRITSRLFLSRMTAVAMAIVTTLQRRDFHEK